MFCDNSTTFCFLFNLGPMRINFLWCVNFRSASTISFLSFVIYFGCGIDSSSFYFLSFFFSYTLLLKHKEHEQQIKIGTLPTYPEKHKWSKVKEKQYGTEKGIPSHRSDSLGFFFFLNLFRKMRCASISNLRVRKKLVSYNLPPLLIL